MLEPIQYAEHRIAVTLLNGFIYPSIKNQRNKLARILTEKNGG